MIRFALSFLTSAVLCAAIMPLIIRFSSRLKIRQTILSYVDNHMTKSGTPTMGGAGFIIALSASSLIFMRGQSSLMLITLAVTAGYGIIGFLDDFIKVYFKQNKGLSPWQKIVFQVIIALIVSFFAFYNSFVGDTVLVPFTLYELHFGFFAIPFYVVIFLAFTNSVNLTDGLDGLASKVTIVYSLVFSAIIGLIIYLISDGQAFNEQQTNLAIFCASLSGALVGFLCYNGYPAKIFMGDTGALALGGALASLAIMTRTELMVPIVGIMYVLTSLSVILQVAYFKATKGKRIFLMAPLHHHFERKGIHENRIVTWYASITAATGVLTVALVLITNL